MNCDSEVILRCEAKLWWPLSPAAIMVLAAETAASTEERRRTGKGALS
jgi:hypothetical protein